MTVSFEEAGLIQCGPDCTLEATILFNHPLPTVLSALEEPAERNIAEALLLTLGAAPDQLVSYRAAQVYEQAGIDPRTVDPILVKLAEREMLLYRAYSREITLTIGSQLSDATYLQALEQRFANRYQRFEERLAAMTDYIKLRPGNRHCRSAALSNYLTDRNDAPLCGKCDLCSPTSEHLPWDPGSGSMENRSLSILSSRYWGQFVNTTAFFLREPSKRCCRVSHRHSIRARCLDSHQPRSPQLILESLKELAPMVIECAEPLGPLLKAVSYN